MPKYRNDEYSFAKEIAADRVSLLEMFELLDSIDKEYKKKNPIQKPTKAKIWKWFSRDIDWWCNKNGINPRRVLLCRKRSTVAFRSNGEATISLRCKEGRPLITYRWSPKKGLQVDGCRTKLLPVELRTQPRRAAMALRKQHRRVYSNN